METNMTNMTVNGIMFQILYVFCQIIKTQIKCFSQEKTMKMKVSKTKSCPKKLVFKECPKLLVEQSSNYLSGCRMKNGLSLLTLGSLPNGGEAVNFQSAKEIFETSKSCGVMSEIQKQKSIRVVSAFLSQGNAVTQLDFNLLNLDLRIKNV